MSEAGGASVRAATSAGERIVELAIQPVAVDATTEAARVMAIERRFMERTMRATR